MLLEDRGRLLVLGLAVSALALLFAPLLMPSSYSWVVHTTSESAAQGIPGAWLARAGFLVFGASVLWIAWVARSRWMRWAVGLHATFGFLMVANAVFSARPWDAELPYSPLEDLLHSIAATALGFAFAFGVCVVALQRWRQGGVPQPLDAIAVAASVMLPLAMVGVSGLTGVFQRVMFLIAYLWYAREALRLRRSANAGRNGPNGPRPISTT